MAAQPLRAYEIPVALAKFTSISQIPELDKANPYEARSTALTAYINELGIDRVMATALQVPQFSDRAWQQILNSEPSGYLGDGIKDLDGIPVTGEKIDGDVEGFLTLAFRKIGSDKLANEFFAQVPPEMMAKELVNRDATSDQVARMMRRAASYGYEEHFNAIQEAFEGRYGRKQLYESSAMLSYLNGIMVDTTSTMPIEAKYPAAVIEQIHYAGVDTSKIAITAIRRGDIELLHFADDVETLETENGGPSDKKGIENLPEMIKEYGAFQSIITNRTTPEVLDWVLQKPGVDKERLLRYAIYDMQFKGADLLAAKMSPESIRQVFSAAEGPYEPKQADWWLAHGITLDAMATKVKTRRGYQEDSVIAVHVANLQIAAAASAQAEIPFDAKKELTELFEINDEMSIGRFFFNLAGDQRKLKLPNSRSAYNTQETQDLLTILKARLESIGISSSDNNASLNYPDFYRTILAQSSLRDHWDLLNYPFDDAAEASKPQAQAIKDRYTPNLLDKTKKTLAEWNIQNPNFDAAMQRDMIENLIKPIKKLYENAIINGKITREAADFIYSNEAVYSGFNLRKESAQIVAALSEPAQEDYKGIRKMLIDAGVQITPQDMKQTPPVFNASEDLSRLLTANQERLFSDVAVALAAKDRAALGSVAFTDQQFAELFSVFRERASIVGINFDDEGKLGPLSGNTAIMLGSDPQITIKETKDIWLHPHETQPDVALVAKYDIEKGLHALQQSLPADSGLQAALQRSMDSAVWPEVTRRGVYAKLKELETAINTDKNITSEQARFLLQDPQVVRLSFDDLKLVPAAMYRDEHLSKDLRTRSAAYTAAQQGQAIPPPPPPPAPGDAGAAPPSASSAQDSGKLALGNDAQLLKLAKDYQTQLNELANEAGLFNHIAEGKRAAMARWGFVFAAAQENGLKNATQANHVANTTIDLPEIEDIKAAMKVMASTLENDPQKEKGITYKAMLAGIAAELPTPPTPQTALQPDRTR